MRQLLLICLSLFLLMGCGSDSPIEKSKASKIKRIALTYDDAPRGTGPRYSGEDRAAAIIEQLDAAKTGPVAMFVTTRGFRKPEGRARIAAYAEAGHLIANHSDTHMWASRTPTAKYIADIDTAETKLEGFKNRRPWFRFPYLDEGGRGETKEALVKRDALRSALAERDLMSGYVTVDTFDWHLASQWKQAVKDGASVDMKALSTVYADMILDSAEHYDALSRRVLGRRAAQVLLLHENDLAASFTVDMVRVLRENGWTIIDPDEAFSDPIATQLPETRFSGMGRIAALAADQGLKGSEVFDHWSVSEKGIEDRLAKDQVFAK